MRRKGFGSCSPLPPSRADCLSRLAAPSSALRREPPTVASATSRVLRCPLTRDRRFRDLSGDEIERMRKAVEAEAAARALAKEEAEKAAKKASKKGGGKGKKPPKGAAAAAPPPTPPEGEAAPEPPSVLEVYEATKREMERHRVFRKEEAARKWAEERLVPRDPTGEAVLREVGSRGLERHVHSLA